MINKKQIKEATGSGSSGHFKIPIVLAPESWEENQLAPFNEPVYHYINAELAYEEADGDFKETPEERTKIENRTKKLSKLDQYLKKFYTGQNDEDGSNLADIESPEKIIQQAVGRLIYVEKKMVNILLVEDLKQVIRVIQNVGRLVLHLKCLTHKKNLLVNKKGKLRKHIQNQVQVTNLR